jgi:Integrase core domain
MGLHADPRGAQEPRASRRSVHDRPHLESAWSSAGARASDLVADVPEAHWGAIAGADFFTTEVWTWKGLVTYYTVFVIDLASRRVQILGSTPHPEALFMQQIVRTLTMAEASMVGTPHVLICDRDRKWSRDVRRSLHEASIRVVLIPERAPNANAYAERFVRSIKEECLDRLIPLGERHFRRAVSEFVAHYHRERNHQGLANT